jgi:hypothetical protein
LKPCYGPTPAILRPSRPLMTFEIQGMQVELYASDRAHCTLFTAGLDDLAAAGVERVAILEGNGGVDGRWWAALVTVEGQRLVVSTLEFYSSRKACLTDLAHDLSDRLRRLALTLVP